MFQICQHKTTTTGFQFSGQNTFFTVVCYEVKPALKKRLAEPLDNIDYTSIGKEQDNKLQHYEKTI